MRKNDICPTWCEHRHKLGKERLSRKSVEAGGWERQVRTVGTHSSCWEPASASPSIECLGLGVTWSGMNLAVTATFTWNWASYVISPSFRFLSCRTGMARVPSAAAAAAKSLQSCPTLCNPIDGSPPGSPVPGILQARTLEWVAISFSNAWKWKVKMKPLSHVRLLMTPWTAAYQASPSMGFSRQEDWSGSPVPSPSTQCRWTYFKTSHPPSYSPLKSMNVVYLHIF